MERCGDVCAGITVGIMALSPPSTYSTSEFSPGDSSRKSARPLEEDTSRRIGPVSELVALEQEVSTIMLSSPTARFRGVAALEEEAYGVCNGVVLDSQVEVVTSVAGVVVVCKVFVAAGDAIIMLSGVCLLCEGSSV